ncbi:hypothetical protein ACFHW0_31175 [Micromonospora sp. LOL_025]|uniref:hypothetical protein n=1 Tax=Micromonospora sp. LOL_025 TaxID=3345413 RepID=UPI003A85E3A3
MSDEVRGVHAYWRVPSGQPRPYRQLSCATWLLSILSWRRYAGPIDLFADRPTMERLDRFGWLGLYDRTEILDDDGLDDRYDRPACFALPKLLALDRYPGSMLVDTDAYLLSPLRPPGTGSVFAHLERGDIDFYSRLHELRNPAAVELPDSLPLVGNTALFRAATPALAARISHTGLAFLADNPTTAGRDVHLHMTVAEQVIATHLTTLAAEPVVNLFEAVWSMRSRTWLPGPPRFGHLWNLKRGGRAETVLATYTLVNRILRDDYGVADSRIRAVLEQV